MEQDFRRSLIEKAKEKTYLGKLVILSGISGSGKNFIADILLDRYNYVLIDKYVTRPFRDKEVTEMSLGKNIGIKAVNGVYNDGEKSVEEQERNANIRKQAFLNLRLPFSYINYGEYYGFSATEINNYLESGRNVTIIVNDIGIVRDLKSIYGENCLACFVYRVNPNNKGIFMQIAGQRHDTQESAEARHKQAVKDFNTYTNNVALYDYTILNTGIGKDGYSIIGQGKIDEILSNKSEDRRKIFEEAAGIVKYRTRKQETGLKVFKLKKVLNVEVQRYMHILEIQGLVKMMF